MSEFFFLLSSSTAESNLKTSHLTSITEFFFEIDDVYLLIKVYANIASFTVEKI